MTNEPKHEATDAIGMESQRDEGGDADVWAVGSWLSAALDDPKVCEDMKNDIREWFDEGGYFRSGRATTQPAEQSAYSPVEGEWQPMTSAPRDGTEIETLCVHPTAHYSADAFGEGWAAIVRAKWTDHNGGGWTWNGLCGVHMAWRSLTTRSVAVSSEAVDEIERLARRAVAEAKSGNFAAGLQARTDLHAALSPDVVLSLLNQARKPEGGGDA